VLTLRVYLICNLFCSVRGSDNSCLDEVTETSVIYGRKVETTFIADCGSFYDCDYGFFTVWS